MRVVAEVAHPKYKISIFYMNQKYLLKIEKGNLEQTFKISELDYIIKSAEDIKTILTEEFYTTVENNFQLMESSLSKALENF